MKHSDSEVKHFLKKIPEYLNNLDYEGIKAYCNSFLPSIPMALVDFKNEKFAFKQLEWGGKNVVYRARINDNPNKKPWPHISDISYMPKDKLHRIEKFGRVNKPKEAMFYGSFNLGIACTEAITKGNVFESTNSILMTVGTWGFETPLKLVQMPYSEKHFKSFYDVVNFKSESIQLEHIEKDNQRMRENFRSDSEFEILQFFADEFAKYNTSNDYEYKLSNYYADRIFNRIKEFNTGIDIDGILYPSIAGSYQHENIVLKPEVIEKKLKFIWADEIWFVSHMKNGGGGEWIPFQTKVREDENGNLLWR